MAWVDQGRKGRLQKLIREALPAHWKVSCAVHHHSTLIVTIQRVDETFMNDLSMVSEDCVDSFKKTGYFTIHPNRNGEPYRSKTNPASVLLGKLFKAIHAENHDNSDPMTDYFDVGYYADLQFGKYGRKLEVLTTLEVDALHKKATGADRKSPAKLTKAIAAMSKQASPEAALHPSTHVAGSGTNSLLDLTW